MSAPVNEGDVLAGKYRVEKVLGIGGMGVVVAAHHIHLDERVAIKFLLPEMLANQEAVGRFLREAKAAVRIKSEHVARVTDVGTLESGAPYMVMEYLQGGDLSSWIERIGKLPIDQAVDFVLQAGEAIAEAHGMGIVHRDLKPANLFVTRKADSSLSVKVLDFGISKVTALGGSGPDMGMTKTTAVLGSPFYMSPEQLESAKSVDARSDVWALGVILYELITGGTPFVADALPELVLKIVRTEPSPLSVTRPDAPPGLQAVVSRCLEKDRTRRYQSVAELAVALRPFASPRSRESVERIVRVSENASRSARGLAPMTSFEAGHEREPGHEPAATTAPGTMASWGNTQAKAGDGRRAVVLAATLVGLGSLGAGAYFLLRSEPALAPSTGASVAAPAEPPSAVARVALAPPEPSAVEVTPVPPPSAAKVVIAAPTPAPQATPAPPSRPAARPAARPKTATVRPAAPSPAPPKVAPATPPAPAETKPAAPKQSVFDDRK